MENYKNKLQEYTQKLALPLPIYEIENEGSGHLPSFKSYVTVDGVRYESSRGHKHKKEAEQSAAQVAVEDLYKNSAKPYKLDEVLGKKLLSEVLIKLGWPYPTFSFTKEGASHCPVFTSTVEINGVQYVGGQGKSKKEAETKTAFAAFQAISAQVDGRCFQHQLPAESKETCDLKQPIEALMQNQLEREYLPVQQCQLNKESENVIQRQEYGSEDTKENKQVVQECSLTASTNKKSRSKHEMESKKREDNVKRQRHTM